MPSTDRPSVTRPVAAFVALALLVALDACTTGAPASPSASPAGSPAASAIVHATGAADLVLRYEEVGGFAGPQAILGRYPAVSVYGDGSVITVGPVPAIFPGPALPNLIVTSLTEAGLTRLLAAAATAGLLGPDAAYDATGIADATTARFTLVADGRRHVISAYALGLTTPDMEGGAGNSAARARLRAFTLVLGDLRGSLGQDVAGPDAPYRYGSLRVLVADGAPRSGDPAVSRPPLAWPLSTPLATFGAAGTGAAREFRCGIVDGTDLDALRPLLAQATQITPWSSGGSLYTLMLLPLLPDETGC